MGQSLKIVLRMMKLTLILLFIFYPGYCGAMGGKFCRGSGGYSGKCSHRVDCKGSSFSFSTTCGFGHVCCKTRGDVVPSEVEFPLSCGKSTLHLPHRGTGSSQRRHGTNLAQPGQLPWMVSFVYQRSGENFCGPGAQGGMPEHVRQLGGLQGGDRQGYDLCWRRRSGRVCWRQWSSPDGAAV